MKRLSVVLDTNVLISAIIFGGKPRNVLRLAVGGQIDAYSSPDLIREFRDVLGRPKFSLSGEEWLFICRELESVVSVVFPSDVVDAIQSDPDDNVVLACAIEACADFIVTGDPHLLDLVEFRGIKIVNPSDFLLSCFSRRGRPPTSDR